MWVLDARANAEKITYPVIWEETKDASNVIDYNINEEITTNASSVFNANNDTTTGLATVIPWVNAPKLIQSTSIYQNTDSLSWGASLSWQINLIYPWDTSWNMRSWTISDTYWNIVFNIKSDDTLWNWLVIPVSWWYEISATYPIWASSFSVDVTFRISKGWYWNDIDIHTYIGKYSTTTFEETFRYAFNAWDVLYEKLELHYKWSSIWFFETALLEFTITKL